MRWIKIYDTLLDWEWYADGNMVRLWLHLLLKANYKDKKWMGKVIKRGQLVTGRVALSEELGISEKSIRTCLSRLVDTGEISIKTTNKYSVITICKYEEYQLCENDERPANGQQAATTIEYKECKNKKNNLKEKEKKEKEDFVAPEFKEAFSMWLEYKRQRRESYKSELSLRKCYNNLLKLSANSPSAAMAIVEQSMANNWAGLFALKQQHHENNQAISREQERAERQKGYLAAIARLAKENEQSAAELWEPDSVPW